MSLIITFEKNHWEFQIQSFLRQDEEFLQEGNTLEMEVREPEVRVELVSYWWNHNAFSPFFIGNTTKTQNNNLNMKKLYKISF